MAEYRGVPVQLSANGKVLGIGLVDTMHSGSIVVDWLFMPKGDDPEWLIIDPKDLDHITIEKVSIENHNGLQPTSNWQKYQAKIKPQKIDTSWIVPQYSKEAIYSLIILLYNHYKTLPSIPVHESESMHILAIIKKALLTVSEENSMFLETDGHLMLGSVYEYVSSTEYLIRFLDKQAWIIDNRPETTADQLRLKWFHLYRVMFFDPIEDVYDYFGSPILGIIARWRCDVEKDLLTSD